MPERRPLASRNTKLAARVTRFLVAKGATPNGISKGSMVFAAFAALAFWGAGEAEGVARGACLLLGALFCQCRLLCNLFDGMVAVEGGQGAPDGPFWNEVPDRVADVLILVGFGLAAGAPVLGWAAAAFAIGTAYVREFGSAQGLAADFSGPMAKPHRMAAVTGASVVAAFVPAVFGWPVLLLALWGITLGTLGTIVRRSLSVLAALKAGA